MASSKQPLVVSHPNSSDKWQRRRDIPLAILAWIALGVILLWAAGYVLNTILLLILGSLLAFAIVPLVQLFARVMPRPLAIMLVYCIFFVGIGLLLYFVVRTAIDQVLSLAHYIAYLLTPGKGGQAAPLQRTLESFGISAAQIGLFRDQLVNRIEALASSALPLVTSIFSVGLDIIVVAVLSIYLVIDGPHIANWMRRNAPRLTRANFVITTVQNVVGGYIRGQILLATLVGLLVGGTTAFFHVPYALLIGILAFILEFIPILGTIVSGFISTLLALTQGIPTAIAVLICFIIIHVIEGDVVGPRIVGKAIGLHPAVSLIAVIAGAELFGIWGALLASPIAGVLQTAIITFWGEWRHTHPEQFSHAADTTPHNEEAEKDVSEADSKVASKE
jgi:predicted PurR-regulated permease PerM